MKVILNKDVKKVGKAGEIVEVSDGYARNFIIAKGLGVAESKTNLKHLEQQFAQQAAQDAQDKANAEKLKEQLAKTTLEFKVKAGNEGRVFGSVSSKQIVAELAKQDIKIDKRKIIDNHNIATLGMTIVKVDLYRNEVIGAIKVHLSQK